MDLRYIQLLCIFCFYFTSLLFIADSFKNILITAMYTSAWMFLITDLIIKFDKEDKEEERRNAEQRTQSEKQDA